MLPVIRSAENGPRLRYVLDVLFRHLCQTDYLLLKPGEHLPKGRNGLLISYGAAPDSEASIHVPEEGLLSERGIRAACPDVFEKGALPYLFEISPKHEKSLSFDLFSAVFFLLTRYEEYLPFQADVHGRFPLSASCLSNTAYPDKPLVHYWADELFVRMEKQGWRINGRACVFRPSYDLDVPWSVTHKRFLQAVGGMLRGLLRQGPGHLFFRYRIWRKPEKDPYFTFPFLRFLHRRLGLQPLYFAPVGDYGRYDKAPSHRHSAYRSLLRTLAVEGEVGLHPSYASHEQPALLLREKKRLEEILDRPVRKSRQHFLRFRFPETPRYLIEAGITDDYTLGFAERPGFRAGVCIPFPWYDLEREEQTSLMLHPLPFMDTTFFAYQKNNPEEIFASWHAFVAEIRQYGGAFIPLWHNNNLSDEASRMLYEKLTEEVVQLIFTGKRF